ncbi:hypothetical protein L7F22_069427 [Adiantum nelumboides]|nr:hypothetical protein [Adiantum nelumboides]
MAAQQTTDEQQVQERQSKKIKLQHAEEEAVEEEQQLAVEEGQSQKLAEKSTKLTLVLDLDETLLNSTPVDGVHLPPEEAAILAQLLHHPAAADSLDLHVVPELHRTFKLRPFVHRFLQEASAMYHLYIYTLSSRAHATAAVRLLDPSGTFFGGDSNLHIISRDDHFERLPAASKQVRHKHRSLIPPAHHDNSSIVILDDRFDVWPGAARDNLILVEAYRFFSSRRDQCTPSLLYSLKDERAEDGILANMLDVLRRLHAEYTNRAANDSDVPTATSPPDVRQILKNLRKQTLAGCSLILSRGVLGSHLWKYDCVKKGISDIATSMGATYNFGSLPPSSTYEAASIRRSNITHALVFYCGLHNTIAQALHTLNLHAVNQNWLYSAYFTWKHPPEDQYLPPASATGTVQPLTFSTTVDLQLGAIDMAASLPVNVVIRSSDEATTLLRQQQLVNVLPVPPGDEDIVHPPTNTTQHISKLQPEPSANIASTAVSLIVSEVEAAMLIFHPHNLKEEAIQLAAQHPSSSDNIDVINPDPGTLSSTSINVDVQLSHDGIAPATPCITSTKASAPAAYHRSSTEVTSVTLWTTYRWTALCALCNYFYFF